MSTNLVDVGNFGCGAVLAEIGLMVNIQALEGIYKVAGNTQKEFDLFKFAILEA